MRLLVSLVIASPCKAGVQACVGGKWETACTGEVVPVAEICGDSQDNNCNGKVDDGCVLTVAGDGMPGYLDGPALTARFNIPQGLAFDSQGNLFVADVVNSRIRKLDTNGMVTTAAGDGTAGYMDGVASSAQFNLPSKLVVDQQGNVFIIEGNSSRIRKLDTNGMVTTVAGDGTAGYKDGPALSAQFDSTIELVFDSQGNLYIADVFNNRIRRLDTQGMVTTVAGDGTVGYKEGSALSAQFANPIGLAIDSLGDLYISDQINRRIRKLVLP